MKLAPRTTLTALTALLHLPLALSLGGCPSAGSMSEPGEPDGDEDPAEGVGASSSAVDGVAAQATEGLCHSPPEGSRLCWDVVDAPVTATAAVVGVFEGEARALIADAALGLQWLQVDGDRAIDLQSIAGESLRWPAEAGVLGDGDGDGLPEIALHTGDHTYWVDVLPGGACDGAVFSPPAAVLSVFAGDLDGDGVDNPIFAHAGAGGVAAITVLLDDVAVEVDVPTITDTGVMIAGDIDGDGHDELLIASAKGEVLAFDVDLAAAAPIATLVDAITGLSSATIVDLSAADLDQDGADDLLVHQRASACDPDACDDVLQIVAGGPGGFDLERQSLRIGEGAGRPVIADLDGDGAPDLATPHASDGAITVLLGDGVGSFRDRFALVLTPGSAGAARGAGGRPRTDGTPLGGRQGPAHPGGGVVRAGAPPGAPEPRVSPRSGERAAPTGRAFGRFWPRPRANRWAVPRRPKCYTCPVHRPANSRLDAAIAAHRDRLATPALLIDLDAVDHNIGAMLQRCGGPSRWRPHIKTIKQAALLQRLVAAGVTACKCATLEELEVALGTGAAESVAIDVLVAYPLHEVAFRAARRAVAAHPGAVVSFLADSPEHAKALGRWAGDAPVRIALDVELGMERSGTIAERWRAHAAAIRAAAPNLEIVALHGYDGHLTWDQRSTMDAGYDALCDLARALADLGDAVDEIVTSGSHSYAAALEHPRLAAGPWTHRVSPGTIVLGDRRCTHAAAELGLRAAAFVATRVISRDGALRITVDAGSKANSPDCPAPNCEVVGWPELFPRTPSEEHLPIHVGGLAAPPLGHLLWLLPEHVCTTVNLYREALLLRDEAIVGVSPIASGRAPWLTGA
ncbi:MAG: alanine racemase [Nannocystaceae bacterium]